MQMLLLHLSETCRLEMLHRWRCGRLMYRRNLL